MKTKRFHKKLVLNKKTIADLNGYMMGNVHGGIDITNSQTDSCCLVHTDCPDCTQTCLTNCNTCGATCVTCSVCITVCDPKGAYC
jgi:hypothetical protein